MASPCLILTRPEGRNQALAHRLQQAGHDVLCLPALALQPCAPEALELAALADEDLLVFVSRQAAQVFVDHLARRDDDREPWPGQAWLGCVGAASARPLHACERLSATRIVHPPADAPDQDSEALWALLVPHLPEVRRATILRGQQGREWLGRQLDAAGVRVRRLTVYERRPARWSDAQEQALVRAMQAAPAPVFLLTSTESLQAVQAGIQALGLERRWADCRFVVIHQRIAGHLQTILGASDARAAQAIAVCAPSDDAMADALMAQAAASRVSLGLQSRHD